LLCDKVWQTKKDYHFSRMNLRTAFLLLTICLLTCACKKNIDNDALDAYGMFAHAEGKVQMVDAEGNVLSWKSGVRAVAVGTSFSTISDTFGMYYFDSLAAQALTVHTTKAGFGADEVSTIALDLGQLPVDMPVVRMGQLPTVALSSLSLQSTTQTGISGSVNVGGSSLKRVVVFYVGKTAGVNNQPANFEAAFAQTVAIGAQKAQFSMNRNLLTSLGFATTDTAFVAAYAANADTTASHWQDATTGKPRFEAVGVHLFGQAVVQ